LIDNGNNLLLSPLREGDGNKEDEDGDQGEEETSLTPLSPARGPQQKNKKNKTKLREKRNKKTKKKGTGVGSGDQRFLNYFILFYFLWRIIFSKSILLKIPLLNRHIFCTFAIFLHIVQASSQDIRGF
jgi:hypothetical protein